MGILLGIVEPAQVDQIGRCHYENRRVAVLTCLQCYRPFFFADRAAQEQLDAAAPRDGTSDPTWPQKVFHLHRLLGHWAAAGRQKPRSAPSLQKPPEG